MLGGGIFNPYSPDVAHTWTANQTLDDDTKLLLGTGGDSGIYFDGSDTYWDLQAVGTGGLTIDIGDGQAPENGNVYIRKTSSGYDISSPGDISANSILNIENNGSTYLSFLVSSSANAGLLVADGSGDVDAGRLWYHTANEDWIFYTAGVERVEIESKGTTMHSSADSAAVADQVTIGRYDIGAGNTVLALSQETAVATETDETKFSHKMQVRLNGATYYMMLTAS